MTGVFNDLDRVPFPKKSRENPWKIVSKKKPIDLYDPKNPPIWELIKEKEQKRLKSLENKVGLKKALEITERKRNEKNGLKIDLFKRYLMWLFGTPVIYNVCSKNPYLKFEVND